MPQIQRIRPSRVVHELISQPEGTYVIRAETDDDHLISRIRMSSEFDSSIPCPYVVLSVRVGEDYPNPIMNYRLASHSSNDQDLLTQYKQSRRTASEGRRPKLTSELIVAKEELGWKIDSECFRPTYLPIDGQDPSMGSIPTKCVFPNDRVSVDVFKKQFPNNQQAFQREFAILKDLCFFHITSFFGITSESNGVSYLVFAHHGRSLKEQLPLTLLPNQSVIQRLALIGYQIAFGMMYLGSKNILHRDLHAGNILEDDRHFIRIADFGHAIVRNHQDDAQRSAAYNEVRDFQIRRLAPECLTSAPNGTTVPDSHEDICRRFSSKSDVWAFALIFIELMLEKKQDVYPYLKSHSVHYQMDRHVKIERKIHKKPSECPEAIYDILKRCWEYDPEDRLSFTNIRQEMFQLTQQTGS